MEDKKTFGEYILQRRKALGMTQREFAERVFVTESAVSKWERGMSYPDISLIRSICEVLEISEHELLSGSEDTARRNSERLAQRYLRLTRNYRRVQYILYGGALAGCLIGNLASAHRLDWFFIVLFALATAASLTLVPALAGLWPKLERHRGTVVIGCFTVSLELLLLACSLYTGGDWFPVAGLGTFFGLALAFLPGLSGKLPQLRGRRSSACLLMVTVLLVLLLLVCSLYTGGGWFVLAAVGTVFGVNFGILPVFLRQLAPPPLRRHKALVYFALQTAFLMLLLLVYDLYAGAGQFLGVSLPVALLCAALPWGIMAAMRYLPGSRLGRLSVSLLWSALWFWLSPYFLGRMLGPDYVDTGREGLWFPYDFTVWTGETGAANVEALVLLGLAAAGVVLGILALVRRRKRI